MSRATFRRRRATVELTAADPVGGLLIDLAKILTPPPPGPLAEAPRVVPPEAQTGDAS